MGKVNRRLPALSGYLNRIQIREPAAQRDEKTSGGVLLALALMVPAGAEGLQKGITPWLALAIAAWAICFVWLARGFFSMNLPRHSGAARLYVLKEQSLLHRRLDPGVAAYLEVASEQWRRIDAALSGPFFQADPLPQHWQATALRLRTDADGAMEALLKHVAAGIGQGECDGEMIERVRLSVAEGDETGHAVRKGMMTPIGSATLVASLRVIMELRQLADEVERLPLASAEHPSLVGQIPTGLGKALTEIEELRVAEAELNA